MPCGTTPLSCLVPTTLIISTDLVLTIGLEEYSFEVWLWYALSLERTRPFIMMTLFKFSFLIFSEINRVRKLLRSPVAQMLDFLACFSIPFFPNFLSSTLIIQACVQQHCSSTFVFLLAICRISAWLAANDKILESLPLQSLVSPFLCFEWTCLMW